MPQITLYLIILKANYVPGNMLYTLHRIVYLILILAYSVAQKSKRLKVTKQLA